MQVVSAQQVARGKPHPDVYVEALRRLGCTQPSQALVVEDAGAAGMEWSGVEWVWVRSVVCACGRAGELVRVRRGEARRGGARSAPSAVRPWTSLFHRSLGSGLIVDLPLPCMPPPPLKRPHCAQ